MFFFPAKSKHSLEPLEMDGLLARVIVPVFPTYVCCLDVYICVYVHDVFMCSLFM